MSEQHLPDIPESWKPVASVFAALGDVTRQKILLLFESGKELSIKDIVSMLPLSRTATVHHLTVLERADILRSRRRGKLVLYRVHPESVLSALQELEAYIRDVYSIPSGGIF